MWLNLLLYVTELKGHLKVKWMQTYAAIVFLLVINHKASYSLSQIVQSSQTIIYTTYLIWGCYIIAK